MSDLINALHSLAQKTEFWSAIAGAIVGGFVALLIQLVNLHAAKKQREKDHFSAQQALAGSLLLKASAIHQNLYGIHHHIETCYQIGIERDPRSEPWNFMMPLANPPETISFSYDEMGMLLAQKDDDVFNLVWAMDTRHNSLVYLITRIEFARRELAARLRVDRVDGEVLSGILRDDERLTLQPRIIEINSLIENARTLARTCYQESSRALDDLVRLLKTKLHLDYRVERLRMM